MYDCLLNVVVTVVSFLTDEAVSGHACHDAGVPMT